jgi:prepilin-type N-terminal cleavage/methylation domain-containing protein
MKKTKLGFTLIELLVVISIIGILAAVIFANVGEGGAQARDTERQADLRNLQSALELYKTRHDRYPEGCRGPNQWSWQSGVGVECPSETQYIEGLAPEFISALPTDPKTNGDNTGYAYRVNLDGTVYKLVAFKTVEELSTIDELANSKLHKQYGTFRLCPYVNALNTEEFLLCSDNGDDWGTSAHYTNYVEAGGCDFSDEDMRTSYAVWGGFADASTERLVRVQTEEVICVKP